MFRSITRIPQSSLLTATGGLMTSRLAGVRIGSEFPEVMRSIGPSARAGTWHDTNTIG